MKRSSKNLSVLRTDQSDEALRVLKETGMSTSEATRWAMTLAANILKHAWMNGHEERGTVPQMRVQFRLKEVNHDGQP